MKGKKIYIFLFVLSLVFGSVFATVADGKTVWKACYGKVGSIVNCKNELSINNDLTNFKHTMTDNYTAHNAYKVKTVKTTWVPKVTRGAPVYKNYIVYDNKNSKYYTYSSKSGKYLNDYGSITLGLGNRLIDFYPKGGQRPTTNLNLRTGDGLDCYAKIHACISAVQANELNIN